MNRSRTILGIFLFVVGVLHFVGAEFFVRMMPDWLPWHLELVWLSGLAEIILGVLAFTGRPAPVLTGYGIILLLIAVYPANIHMAMYPERFPEATPWILYIRLPIQFVFIWWAYRALIAPSRRLASATPSV